MLPDMADRILPEQGGHIAGLVELAVVAIPVGDAMHLVGVVVDLADQRAVLVVEPALLRPELAVGMAEMPFADDRSAVAGFFRICGSSSRRAECRSSARAG